MEQVLVEFALQQILELVSEQGMLRGEVEMLGKELK